MRYIGYLNFLASSFPLSCFVFVMDQSDRICCIHKHDQMRDRKNQEDIDNSHTLKKDGLRPY